MEKLRTLLIASFSGLWLLLMAQPLLAQTNSEDIVGTWLTQSKEGKVEIYKQGNKYFGKIVWLQKPNEPDGKPKLDKNNPDASKRMQALIGLVNVQNLEWKGEGEWGDGKVYDPKNGKTYSATTKMKDKNTLEFTGYIGFSFIGRSEIWTRVK
jgi:uncharacterized protein (DUF2147 family)